ncbi:molybdenum transport system permease protein ModB [mine drainage metagenome]|uniref:Molybdenum transport system permease protein ModB n=1 Tax=mine drainage metagenome TaxID=410659 RepID=A0A1J5RKE9_9ZZZZ
MGSEPTRRQHFAQPRGLMLVFSLLGGLLLIFIALPLLRLFGAQSAASLMRVAAMAEVRSSILLSVEAATLTTVCAALLGVPLAYLLGRSSFRGKRLVEAIIDLPLAVPHTVVGIALLFVFGRTGIIGAPVSELTGYQFWGSAGGIVIAMLYVSVTYTVDAARVGFEAVDQRLEKVARTLGAGRWAVFLLVSLPLAARGILAGLALTFARSISEFGSVIVLTYYPMTAPVKIYDLFLQFGLGDSSAMAALFLAVTLSLFVLFRLLFRPRRDTEQRG